MSRENKQRKLERRRQLGKNRPGRQWDRLDKHLPATTKLISYNVSFEALNDASPETQMLLRIDEDRRMAVHDLLYENPTRAVEPIRQLLREYPGTPTLVQWLIVALNSRGEFTEADQLAEENHRNHPDYLFARLDYLSMLMHRGELAKVEQILDKRFDLKVMYPRRNTFHVSEVLAFDAFMVQFFARKGDLKTAEIYWGVLDQLAPDGQATKVLRSLLDEATLMKNVKQMASRLLGRMT